jgi:hypothetical protein
VNSIVLEESVLTPTVSRYQGHDLGKAIACISEAVNITPEENCERLKYINDLGTAILSQTTDKEVDFGKAIEHIQEAIDITPHGHLDRIMYLNNLRIAFSGRFHRRRNPTDLDHSIQFKQ